MRSAWDDIEDNLQAAQENTFGEFFTYEPRVSRANKPTVADPARPVVKLSTGSVYDACRQRQTASRLYRTLHPKFVDRDTAVPVAL
jgi:hypothetical protein